MGIGSLQDNALNRLYNADVHTLAAGEALTVRTSGVTRMAVKLGSGATLRWSPVDTHNATAHDTDHQTDVTVQPNVATDVAWPYHRIEAIGGTVRVSFLP